MVPSSSGQDTALSRRRHGFDSRWDYQILAQDAEGTDIKMNIPDEFKDYLLVESPLPVKEQHEKFCAMHLREIEERSCLLRNLGYDKREAKKRIKQNLRWEFELMELPPFYNAIDKIVDKIYEAKPPVGW